MASQLSTSACARLHTAFRPATYTAYTRMFSDFIAFLVVAGLCLTQVSTLQVLAFTEFLYLNRFSPSNIANHLAGIKAMFIIYNLDYTAFLDHRIQLYLKSLKINRPFQPHIPQIIDEYLLARIVAACDHFPNHIVFKALYTISFFSFLRLSNLLPHSIKMFDISRQLCRGDIFFSQNTATILIKWSKTIQNRQEIKTIVIPLLHGTPICPVQAVRHMLAAYPDHDNAPLFQIPSGSSLIPLTDSKARKHLKNISLLLQITPTLTFHMFRKGGTTWAFNHGVPIENIMQHGTWSSQTVWRYIKSVPSASSLVSTSFQNYLQP